MSSHTLGFHLTISYEQIAIAIANLPPMNQLRRMMARSAPLV
jgi:hypothetical protein